jgi:Bacterial Ig-like domain
MIRAALLLLLAALLGSLSCIDLEPPPPRSGYFSGRVLVSPGVPLANATVTIEQLRIYDGQGVVRAQVDVGKTDEDGYFDRIPTHAFSGVLRLRAGGGQYRDLVSNEAIQLDLSTELRALYFASLFEEQTVLVTPVHTLVDARFRSRVREVKDVPQAVKDAYRIIGAHFGALEWERVIPADLSKPAISPTDDVRAAFVLGGLSVLADDVRASSDATPQAVNLFTLLAAAAKDLSEDPIFDGNDGNSAAPGSGLQIGTCAPVDPSCAAPPGGCQLGACRTGCEMYANLLRTSLVGAMRKFIGTRSFPSLWNATGLGAEDARPLLESMGSNTDVDLFGTACLETTDRVAPTIVWETFDEGAFVRGTISVRARATDDAEATPRVSFDAHPDTDGNPSNQIATAVIDTTTLNGGSDGAFTLTAVARDGAGNERRSTRTFEVDNTPPTIALQAAGFLVDSASGVWWTGDAAPTLRGAVDDAHLQHVQVVIAGEVVAVASVEGTTWTAALPTGKVTAGGNEVIVRAVDLAGNTTMTTPVQLRLDTTPPGILAETSPVYDEGLSTVDYDLDDAPANTWVQRHVVGGAPIDLAQSMPGACATVRKFSHLLFQQHVLGSAGALNPLQSNWFVSDDGVGIAAGTTQLRVTLKNGAAVSELIPWTPVSGVVIGPQATRYGLGLYRDGPLAIAALGTTEGEYHVELRAVDRLGRTAKQERCWVHRILAPQLRPVGATTGASMMFPVSLQPTAGQLDVTTAFLNPNATGAGMWIRRVRNYLSTPVFLNVTITPGVDAEVSRTFSVRNALANPRGVTMICGVNPCSVVQASQVDVAPPARRHDNLKLRARMFLVTNGQLGPEVFPCAGCTNDDEAQSYTFEIPARPTPQGAPLAEYAIVTHLRPTLPAGGGTDVLMAPQEPPSGVYGEFVFNGVRLTGRADPPGLEVCTAQEEDFENNRWICIERSTRQTYRALTSVQYRVLDPLVTTYQAGATSALFTGEKERGRLQADTAWAINESALP